jgi:hypothetical protein
MKSLQKIEDATLKVLRAAVDGAAEKHRLMGVPMVIWKNGRMVEILPEAKKSPRVTTRRARA